MFSLDLKCSQSVSFKVVKINFQLLSIPANDDADADATRWKLKLQMNYFRSNPSSLLPTTNPRHPHHDCRTGQNNGHAFFAPSDRWTMVPYYVTTQIAETNVADCVGVGGGGTVKERMKLLPCMLPQSSVLCWVFVCTKTNTIKCECRNLE